MEGNDIVILLYRMKVNIRKVEAGDQSVLNAIKEDFLEFMELIKLFLIAEKETYYGYFLMNMAFEVNFNKNTIAGIKLREYPPVFVSNPLLLCKFNLKEIIFIACHEVEHILLNHPAEMLKASPSGDEDVYRRFNYAADASVNDRLIAEKKRFKQFFLSFPEGCIDSVAFAECFSLKNVLKEQSYLYYYNLIKDQQVPNQFMNAALQNADSKDQGGASSDGMSDMAGTTKEEAEAEESQAEGTQGEGTQAEEAGSCSEGPGVVTAKNCDSLSDHDWESMGDAETAQELTREFVNEVVNTMDQKVRGSMPSEFFSLVDRLNEPAKIPWEKVLKKYVGTITAGSRKTRMRLNRRQPERFDLSGSMPDKVVRIVVAIDTSGSLNDRLLSYIFTEIFEILSKKAFSMTIIECDSKVQRVYQARSIQDIRYDVRGRGGTAFSPVMKYLNQNKKYRDHLLIFFTDGYGEEVVPRPLVYRTLWVLTQGSDELSVKEPYGKVLKMEEDHR